MKRHVIFHPILFAAAPVLALYIVNAEQLYWQEILGTLLVVFAVTSGLWLGLRLLLKDSDKAAWLVSLFLITFFSYNRIWPATDSTLLPKFLLWLGALLTVLVWTARSRRNFKLATRFMNVVSIGWLVAILLPWAYYSSIIARDDNFRVAQYVNAWEAQSHIEQPTCGTGDSPSARPDIYYIILDGYGRADILQKLYDFDDVPFDAFLQEKGFYVAEHSTPNYAQTALSLSSSLNFQYLDDLATQLGAEAHTLMPLRAMVTSSRLWNFLQSFGYQLAAFSSGYPPTEMINADRYFAPALNLSAFQQELINLTPLPVLFAGLPGFSQYDIHRERILFALEQLPAVAELPEPTLTFVHLLAPHPPFVFGPSGEAVQANAFQPFSLSDGSFFAGGPDQYIAAYRDQITFITQKVQQVVARILARSPKPPIIIIQGDHGPGAHLNWQSLADSYLPERFSILNAYYFPDHNYAALYPAVTPVNTFRIVLNQFFCGHYPLLPDKNYFSPIGRSYAFTDVTSLVQGAP